jgi:hypothetical protein
VFPEARFIHVIRDGRAVANSWLQTSWWTGYQGPSRWYLGPLPEPYATEWETSDHSFVLLAGLGWKLLLDGFDTAHALVAGKRSIECDARWMVQRPGRWSPLAAGAFAVRP